MNPVKTLEITDAEPASATRSHDAVQSPKDAATVLVVDDDFVSRTLVQEALTAEGFSVVEAEDGETALPLFEADRPDLVILDAVMPGRDGFEVCRLLRALPGGADVPVLILTGLEDVQAIARAFEAGATDFATKPIPWQILAHRARYMLRAKHTLEALRRSESRLASAQQIALLGHWEYSPETGEFHWSEQLSRIFGLPAGTVIPDLEAIVEHIHPRDRDIIRQAREGLSERASHADFRVVRPDGAVRYMHEHAEVVTDDTGGPARVVGTIQDVTDRKAAEDRARFLANYDELTELPNRRLLVKELGLALARARRSNRPVAVLFLDIDRFKRINDTLGHAAGDRMLQTVGERLHSAVRESDPVGRGRDESDAAMSMIARFAGDEFIVILPDLAHVLDADRVARRILRSIREPQAIDGHELVVTASIGISIFPNDGDTADTLLRNADAAMYHAKERGRDSHAFYDLSMNTSAIERLTLETELHRAIEENQFVLYFQPQVDVNGRIVGVEALLRWQHPTRGLIAPDAFIPLTEETGLIVPIGEWVVRAAFAQAKAWNNAGTAPLRVSVNLSGRQFQQRDLQSMLERTAEAVGLSPALIELEITESVVLEETGENIATVRALQAKGFSIAVDDFGTGYSSLSYLTRLPIDRIKIDRSFIRNVLTEPHDAAVSMAIIAIARALKLECVAEGVETVEQADFLVAHGCQFLQGYLFSPPVTAQAFAVFLQSPTIVPHRAVRDERA